MGTRAAFFIGDFRKPEAREWLGCIAWDGYPDDLPELCRAKSEESFRAAIAKYSERDDFAPSTGPFPFPWMGDLCLTDETYTWFDGEVWCEYDRRFVPLAKRLKIGEVEGEMDARENALKAEYPNRDCVDIPSPGEAYDGSAPDSIMLIGVCS